MRGNDETPVTKTGLEGYNENIVSSVCLSLNNKPVRKPMTSSSLRNVGLGRACGVTGGHVVLPRGSAGIAYNREPVSRLGVVLPAGTNNLG